nr:beta-galactosidase 8-like [Ipomoea batatas]
MVATDPTTTSLGSNLEATVYKAGSGSCSAFLANFGTQSDATVSFNGNSYHLPAWSVSILPDCKNVALNTAKINSVETITRFVSQASKASISQVSLSDWSWYNEPVGISSNNAFSVSRLLEQINTTADKSDYCWVPPMWKIGKVEACWQTRKKHDSTNFVCFPMSLLVLEYFTNHTPLISIPPLHSLL